MTRTALILGATGRMGRHAAAAFEAAGWAVTRFKRGGDLTAAAQGQDVIVNAWNPPYPEWARTVPGLTQQVIAAARASGATVIIPGNVYVFGPGAPAVFADDTAHGATNLLGRIRIEMEAAYRVAGVPTIILRAGDYIDTSASGNWFDGVITKSAAKGKFAYPGPMDRPHAWAYLPDVARAMVALAERDDLPVYADVPFPGYTLTGEDLRAAVESAQGRPQRHSAFPWWLISLLRPVWPMARGLVQMRYLWSKPHRLDATTFDRLVPGFRATPVDEALRKALKG